MSEERLYRDGKLAVVLNDAYGFGISQSSFIPDCNFNKRLILAILGELDKTPSEVISEFYKTPRLKWDCLNLIVEWIPIGTKFKICETDGWESIDYYSESEWLTA